MNHRVLAFVMMILTCHCSKEENTDGVKRDGNSSGLVSHYGCVETAEWNKCSAHVDRNECRMDRCEASSGQCLPDRGSCAQYATEDACEAAAGCTYFIAASAPCVAVCELAPSEERCSDIAQCTWLEYFGCISANDTACASHNTKQSCEEDSACVVSAEPWCWHEDACDSGLYLTESACNNAGAQCEWYESWGCGPAACWYIEDEATCAASADCGGWLAAEYYCDTTESAACYNTSLAECDASEGCFQWVECLSNMAPCRSLDTEACKSREDCAPSGWCTSTCYDARTKPSCEAAAGGTCTWQQVQYRAGPQFRCITACHKNNLD